MELCSKEILTQEFLRGKTIASLVDSHRGDERVLAQAFDAIEDVAEAIGAMMFGDQHPGNVMLLDDGTAGLIDFGQCVEVSDESLRMLCHIVMLLRTRNKFIISQAVAMNDDFSFNTEDLDLQLALLHYFFDTSMSGEGLVPQGRSTRSRT
ncbi:hypothetical protein JL722_8708 [Aureococcus anophagefferens]|nr:hypothetical protein JL722_8708 [Aureococcus anophagefferens]